MNIKKIALSTSAFGYTMGSTGKNTDRKNSKPWTLEKFVDFTRECGLGGIEAPLARFVPDLNIGRLKKLKDQLASANLFFLMDVEIALDADQIRAMIPWAKEFGSGIIRIKSSNILGCSRQKLSQPWIEHVKNCIRILKSLAPELRQEGLKVAIENHQDLDSNDLKQIITEVGVDVVGVNLDIGNAFSVCEDPMVFAQKLGPSIINIHLKDYKIFKSEDGFRLVRCSLGEGEVDFKSILPWLAKSAPDAKMVIELGALEARNVAWLASGFWSEIQSRTQSELVTFFQQLENKISHPTGSSWQTPWERGEFGEDIINYEIAELKASLNYLANL